MLTTGYDDQWRTKGEGASTRSMILGRERRVREKGTYFKGENNREEGVRRAGVQLSVSQKEWRRCRYTRNMIEVRVTREGKGGKERIHERK